MPNLSRKFWIGMLSGGLVVSELTLAPPACPADPLTSLVKGTIDVAGAAAKMSVKAGEVVVGAAGEAGKVSVKAGEVAVGATGAAAEATVGATGKVLGVGGDREGPKQQDLSHDERDVVSVPDSKVAPGNFEQVAQTIRGLDEQIAESLSRGKICPEEGVSLREEMNAIFAQIMSQRGGRGNLSDSETVEFREAVARVEARYKRYLARDHLAQP